MEFRANVEADRVNPYESPLGLEDEPGPTPEKFLRACLWFVAVLVGLTFWPVVAIWISRWEEGRRGGVHGILVCGLSIVATWGIGIAGAAWWCLLMWLFK